MQCIHGNQFFWSLFICFETEWVHTQGRGRERNRERTASGLYTLRVRNQHSNKCNVFFMVIIFRWFQKKLRSLHLKWLKKKKKRERHGWAGTRHDALITVRSCAQVGPRLKTGYQRVSSSVIPWACRDPYMPADETEKLGCTYPALPGNHGAAGPRIAEFQPHSLKWGWNGHRRTLAT